MARGRRKRRRLAVVLFLALAFVVVGFLFRRLLMPRAVHYLVHRPAPTGTDSSDAEAVTVLPNRSPETIGSESEADREARAGRLPREDLSPSDRRALDALLRNKAESH